MGIIEMVTDLVARLKLLRSRENITQEALAGKVNVTRESITSYETGKATPPLEVLLELADYYKVSLDYLTGRSPYPNQAYESLLKENDITLFNDLYSLSEKDRERAMSVIKILGKE
ncbi:MAG: helix-turn-helix transcriptional regulator [Anaerovoracaceae bacterium]